MDRSSDFSCVSSCVKLYLCSNPEDSAVERRALRESVFPRFREHCRHTLGLDVQVIDPYECSDPGRWPDETTRHKLIQECRDTSAGPFLLALVGHQYGAFSLPSQVEVSEFQLLLQESQRAGLSTLELERVYGRDENTIPPSYCLRPPHEQAGVRQAQEKETEEMMMMEKDEERKKVFQTAVGLCVHHGLMTPEKAGCFYRSALDADLRVALGNRPQNDITGRCLVYVHRVISGNKKKDTEKSHLRFQSEAAAPDQPTDEALLSELCDIFLPGLITSYEILLYTITTECDRRYGYTTARRRTYADSLCQQAYSDLVKLTDSFNMSDPVDALARGKAEQEELCTELSQFYELIRPEEDEVKAYVLQRDQQCPLVLTGGTCTGKTVLMAHCARQIKSWFEDSDPVVITSFCNLSGNPSTKLQLSSLCSDIERSYRSHDTNLNTRLDSNCTDVKDVVSNTEKHVSDSDGKPNAVLNPKSTTPAMSLCELKVHLSTLLSSLPSPKRPLVLILDGLDQTENNCGLQVIERLPSPLPPGVKLILTVSSNQKHILQAIRLHYPQCSPPLCNSEDSGQSGYVHVQLGPACRKGCVKMLASHLCRSGRRVTSGQQALVNQALTSCCLPLYVRLLHTHASLWHSDSEVTESSLPDGVHPSISALLDLLEQKHGYFLVSRAVSYLTLSRTGLTEAELTDLLSSDNRVLAEYVQQGESSSSKMRVSQVSVERLLLDLRGFLMRRTVGGSHVLFWVSRHFGLVVAKRYLGANEVKRELHSEMADYFTGRWACGCSKPLQVNQESGEMAVYVDRQPASQPFAFSSSKGVGRVNLRKVLELPHHLQESGRGEELEDMLLTSLGFHQAMVRAGLLEDLVVMLDGGKDSSGLNFARERWLLGSILKSSSCFLQSSPLEMPTVMEMSLIPYLEAFPALEGYIREIRKERRKSGSGVGVVLWPAPSAVPAIKCVQSDAKTGKVKEAAGTECGIVAVLMDDDSLWIWKGVGCDIVELSLNCEQEEVKFAGVKSSGQFILLSTHSNKLLMWDVTGPECFLEVKDPSKTESSQCTLDEIQRFAACQEKICVQWKDESFVSVFEISSETMTHFQCQSSVNCLVCSSDCTYMYCGEEGGTVSIFNTNTRSLLGTCSRSSHSAVVSVILCENNWEMLCVDRRGNVALWDVAAKAHLPILLKEGSPGAESNDVLSTDYSNEFHTLLVCQSQQVTLWDTLELEELDQFLAPRGKTFTEAVFSHDGHLFLALLDKCCLVLVWSVSTGKCLLSLETGTSTLPFTLIKTASDVICVGRDGCLTLWDSEMICAAGTALKMGCGVKEVAVEQEGEGFYTTDGSEMVWKWNLETGLPYIYLQHNGPVEKLRLSLDSVHLVILSAGEIYIWQTKSGLNIVRISGSRATDILLTPNCNFGVSVSERGLSRVWKLANGGAVCSIHLYLSDAQISSESTFLIGRRRGDLLAASLWSGSISKRFSCVESSEHVVAFHSLSEHPDFVVVIAASGSVYTWKVAEETVCRHFQLPYTLHCQPQDFHMSSDGSYALLSTDNEAVTILDLTQIRLCSFKAKGPVIKACLDRSGLYVIYVSCPTDLDSNCVCHLHVRPVLTVIRLADGTQIGSVCLPKNPLTLAVCEQQCVVVGFEDGSVGVYSLLDVNVNGKETEKWKEHLPRYLSQCPFDRTLSTWVPLKTPNITWP
ncbi:NACHT and WD repeat domain-containing protein 2 [Sphaeramia orbicularis]|uniref:NACHT and WD repeat domain-containing protein 2 n=1 Tax=Sphaeramia orbicularis TaxID=375764 RepID=UPI00117C0C82|nr:NACHT and WD repeat domain-containing protein 2-like [Sphaeramia orbicularis]